MNLSNKKYNAGELKISDEEFKKVNHLFHSILTENDRDDIFSEKNKSKEEKIKQYIDNINKCIIFFYHSFYPETNIYDIKEFKSRIKNDSSEGFPEIFTGSNILSGFFTPEILIEKNINIANNIFPKYKGKNAKFTFKKFTSEINILNKNYGIYLLKDDKYSLSKQNELFYKIGQTLKGFYCNKIDFKRSLMVYTILIKITLLLNKKILINKTWKNTFDVSAKVIKNCLNDKKNIDEFIKNAEDTEISYCSLKLNEYNEYIKQNIISKKEFCYMSLEAPWYFNTNNFHFLIKLFLCSCVIGYGVSVGIPWLYPTFSLGYMIYDKMIQKFTEENNDFGKIQKYFFSTIKIKDLLDKYKTETISCNDTNINAVVDTIKNFEETVEENHDSFLTLLMIYKKIFNLICGQVEIKSDEIIDESIDESTDDIITPETAKIEMDKNIEEIVRKGNVNEKQNTEINDILRFYDILIKKSGINCIAAGHNFNYYLKNKKRRNKLLEEYINNDKNIEIINNKVCVDELLSGGGKTKRKYNKQSKTSKRSSRK